jgi:predicted ATPase
LVNWRKPDLVQTRHPAAFISYQRTDEAFARQVRAYLVAAGVSTWMDQYDIPAGAYWPDEIDAGLAAADVVVGLLSPDAVASRNVKNEWDWALANGKRLLLLQVVPCVVPHRYIAINYIDATGSDPLPAMQSLVRALEIAPVADLERTPMAAPRITLPHQRAALIGREREVAEIVELLARDDVSLVTIVGPGGVGKTSLALHVADDVAEQFPDSVTFVQFAPVRDPALVLPTIAVVLGVQLQPDQPVEAALASALHDRRLLLLLDNFEHVSPAAPAIGALLSACPRLTVLATSRTPLNLRREHRYPVRPLALPDPSYLTQAEDLMRVPAVQLFIERARVVQPDLVLTTPSLATIASLCRRLDGLPLAIELAAARTAVLSPDAILTRLGQQAEVLTSRSVDLPERHRTLRNTIAWSYDLLDPSEQELFRQLSVFSGGWTLESAEATCAIDGDLLESLTTLVEANLVRQEVGDSGLRFGMLETIHDHAAELLEQHSATALVRDRHADTFVRLAEVAGPQLQGSTQVAWSRRLSAELGNLHAALGCAYLAIWVSSGATVMEMPRGWHNSDGS